jgi:hypothetical protein
MIDDRRDVLGDPVVIEWSPEQSGGVEACQPAVSDTMLISAVQ